MEVGTILKWLKAEGDKVAKDETLFEMETDKAVVEVPSPADGILLRIVSPEGPVKVETVAGWVGDLGDFIPACGADGSPAAMEAAVAAPQRTFKGPTFAATPAARRRADELGVDLRSMQGTGPGGRITQEDVEQATQSEADPERKLLARHVLTAWQTTPHIHVSRRLNARGLIEARRGRSPNASITDLLLYVLSRLLPQFPELTRTWTGENLTRSGGDALAFAVDTARGVVTPVIHNARPLSLGEISAKRRELTEGSRQGRLKLEDLEGGAFTLTNLGMEGVDFFAPIINAPQTAILAVGQITQDPVVFDGAVVAGWRMWATLAVDHRVLDGVAAGRFLAQLQKALDQLPNELETI